MKKAIQAKHIPDLAVLVVLNLVSRTPWDGTHPLRKWEPRPVTIWELQERFNVFPPKVVLAKLAAPVRRKLLDGCTCGC